MLYDFKLSWYLVSWYLSLMDSRPWNVPFPVFFQLIDMGKIQSRIFIYI